MLDVDSFDRPTVAEVATVPSIPVAATSAIAANALDLQCSTPAGVAMLLTTFLLVVALAGFAALDGTTRDE